jgi:GntR family transcriptional repressor for pyruvate dehydrogenase complex
MSLQSAMDPAWRPVALGGRLYERIVERLENLIAAKGLQSGDRLPSEREMADLLRVSRPSIREAVRTLEGRGRLRVLHGKGIFMSQPAAEDGDLLIEMATRQIGLRELFAMREVLEVPAAGWAAESATASQLELLISSFDALDAAAAEAHPDYVLMQALDSTFHLRIAEAAGNRFMLRTLGVLQEMLAAGMQTTLTIPGRLALSRRDHWAICDAIVRGKEARARQAMRAHIRSVGKAALKRLASEGTVVTYEPIAGRSTRPTSRQRSPGHRDSSEIGRHVAKPNVPTGATSNGS